MSDDTAAVTAANPPAPGLNPYTQQPPQTQDEADALKPTSDKIIKENEEAGFGSDNDS